MPPLPALPSRVHRRRPQALRREVLAPRRAASAVGALVLTAGTMLMAIAASSLLLRDARGARASSLRGAQRAPSAFKHLDHAERVTPTRGVRPATPCYATRASQPLRPPR